MCFHNFKQSFCQRTREYKQVCLKCEHTETSTLVEHIPDAVLEMV